MESAEEKRLLEMLPGIYRQYGQLGEILSAFEAVLLRPDPKSLEQQIDDIHTLFNPKETPPRFLSWLGQWVALAHHEGIPEARHRRLIARMIPLYRIRGTREYVEELIGLYTGAKVTVEEEDLPGMVIGVRSTIGYSTRLGEDPFRFHVHAKFSPAPADDGERSRQVNLLHRVIKLAKPAYTHYRLTHNMIEPARGLILGRSSLGIDSLLWSSRQTPKAKRSNTQDETQATKTQERRRP